MHLMRYQQLQAFEKHLRASGDHLASVYLVISKEPFYSDQAVDLLTQALFQGRSRDALSLRSFDGEERKLDHLLEEMALLPVFSPIKVILVRRLDRFNKEALKQIEKSMASLPKGVTLIFCAEALAANTTFFKQVDQQGVIFQAGDLKPWQKEGPLTDWVLLQASREGKKLSHAAAQSLVQRSGMNASVLMQEWEKLLCYCGEREEISPQDIQAVSSSAHPDDIWKLGEAILTGDASEALQIVRTLIQQGGDVIGIIAPIRYQLQQQYQLCSLVNSGADDQALKQAFPKWSPALLHRHKEKARRYGMERFKRALLELSKTEMLAKDGSSDALLLADRLIFQLTGTL